MWGWRVWGSAVKNAFCYFTGLRFHSQHPCCGEVGDGGSQPSVLPVPEDSTLSLGFCGHQTCMWCAGIYASYTPTEQTELLHACLPSGPSLLLHSPRQKMLLIFRLGSSPPLIDPIKKISPKLNPIQTIPRGDAPPDARSGPADNSS